MEAQLPALIAVFPFEDLMHVSVQNPASHLPLNSKVTFLILRFVIKVCNRDGELRLFNLEKIFICTASIKDNN